jgi:hypothetical protein
MSGTVDLSAPIATSPAHSTLQRHGQRPTRPRGAARSCCGCVPRRLRGQRRHTQPARGELAASADRRAHCRRLSHRWNPDSCSRDDAEWDHERDRHDQDQQAVAVSGRSRDRQHPPGRRERAVSRDPWWRSARSLLLHPTGRRVSSTRQTGDRTLLSVKIPGLKQRLRMNLQFVDQDQAAKRYKRLCGPRRVFDDPDAAA